MALSRRKKIIFSLIPAGLLILTAVAGEIGLRLFGGRFADDPYLNMAVSKSIFEEKEIDGVRYYEVTHPQAYGWRGMRFPIEKSKDTFRVFLLGGSACAGYPHPPEHDFGDDLQHALATAYPDRKIEVLNVAAHGYASYRVRDVFTDVIEYDPDLIVLYSGNNEFLERRTYLDGARTFVQGSYLLRFINIALDKTFNPENSVSAWGFSRDVELAMIFAKIEQQALDLRRDPAQFAQVTEHYEYSMDHMMRTARERGVRLAVLTVPSNLRDWLPNVSWHELSEADEQAWRTAYEAGRRAMLNGDPHAAAKRFGEAITHSATHAESRFWLARALAATDDWTNAALMFRQAKELDYNPFRALDSFNQTLRDLAQKHTGTILVDAVAEFSKTSRHGVPGFDLFLDYVHPNRRGNLILAEMVYDQIIAADLVGVPATAPQFATRQTEYRESLDIDMSYELVMLYLTMHQYQHVTVEAARALELLRRGEGRLRPNATIKRTREEFEHFFTRALEVHEAYLAAENARYRGEDYDPGYKDALRSSYREFFFKNEFVEAGK